jgi:glutamate racemase
MIGILDSGIGGLITARKIMEQLPGYDITYFGDTARAPYGNKSADTIIKFSLENTEALLAKGAKIILITCHTVSSIASQHVKEKIDIPVFEAITPAVKMALRRSKKFIIGVMASRATVASDIYRQEITRLNPDAKVYSTACPLLVPLVEERWLKKPDTVKIVKKYLHPLKVRQIDTLVLGCTHYSLLKKAIQRKAGKRVQIIDAAYAAVGAIRDFVQDGGEHVETLSRKGRCQFFVSDLTEQLIKNARSIAKKPIRLDLLF